MISIHALREESDVSTDWLLSTKGGISIHALREESDATPPKFDIPFKYIFQSTLSARRATIIVIKVIMFFPNFNPRSPRGERQAYLHPLSIN